MRLDFESEMVEELDYNELLFQDVIGEGSYGRVSSNMKFPYL